MKRPNILIFMADHLMADVVREGHPCIMPAARRLAAEGVRFDRTFCTAPHCCPSRASFYTGQYPSIHGVWNNVDNMSALSHDLNEGVPTFAESLAGAGYGLAFAGKWHISSKRNPASFGWQEFWARELIYPVDNNFVSYHAQQANLPVRPGLLRRPGWTDRQYYGVNEAHLDLNNSGSSAHIVNRGIEGIRAMARTGRPWCTFISVNPPHDPYHPPQHYADQYAGTDAPLPASWGDWMQDKPRIYQRMRRQYWSQFSEAEYKDCLKGYWGLCTMVDDYLSRILDALEATGQSENTLVLFTSDHGDYAAAHGLWAKGVPAFREAYAIPAIVRWPAGIRNPGRQVDELVSITDFMPTFVELATGKAPDVYGDSLLPFLADERPAQWRDTLFTQMNGVELYYTQRIIMTQKWKYVYNGFDFDELYNLENDPHEMVNLANPDLYDQSVTRRGEEYIPWPRMTPELEGVRKDMLARMWRFAREQKDGRIYTGYSTTAMAPYGPGLVK